MRVYALPVLLRSCGDTRIMRWCHARVYALGFSWWRRWNVFCLLRLGVTIQADIITSSCFWPWSSSLFWYGLVTSVLIGFSEKCFFFVFPINDFCCEFFLLVLRSRSLNILDIVCGEENVILQHHCISLFLFTLLTLICYITIL